MSGVLLTVLPLYIIIAIGALLRITVADEKWIEVFNKYGLYLGFPAIVFSSIIKIPAGGILDARIIVSNVILLLVAVVVTWIVCRVLKTTAAMRNTYLICVFYGNVAYLGFPFITEAIPGSDASVSIHIAIYVTFLFTVGILVLELSKEKHTSYKTIVLNMLKNPLLLSVFAGLLFRMTGWHLPVSLAKTLSILEASASPIVLLAIGMFIARRLEFDRRLVHAGVVSGLKLIALPLMFLLYARLAIPQEDFAISIIEAAMPVGITSFALAEIYPIDKHIVASVIVLSTVVSALTLPAITSGVL